MFDPVYFEDQSIVIERTRETVLSDAKFRERSAGQRFEKVIRLSPLGVHDLVKFRDEGS